LLAIDVHGTKGILVQLLEPLVEATNEVAHLEDIS